MAPGWALADDLAPPTSVSDVTVTATQGGFIAAPSLSRLPGDLKGVPQSVTVLNQTLLLLPGRFVPIGRPTRCAGHCH